MWPNVEGELYDKPDHDKECGPDKEVMQKPKGHEAVESRSMVPCIDWTGEPWHGAVEDNTYHPCQGSQVYQ